MRMRSNRRAAGSEQRAGENKSAARCPLPATRWLALLCLALVACHGKQSAPSGSRGTPVFLISVDTLRSDHLPAYGYKDVDTPHIDALRDDGILYEHAYSHCPLTLPSHTTVFTGMLPAENGVRDNIGYQLGEHVQTLPAVMKANGYATGAAVSAFVLRKDTGIGRGFDMYDDMVEPVSVARTMGRVQRNGDDTVKVAKSWIAANVSKPEFFFLHLYEPHTPYEPPEPYKSKYALPYDGEIARVDQIVGDYIDFLKKEDLYDKSLIIFFSDHGEGLYDHGEEEHGMFLYRETIQVPMIVKLPKQKLSGTTVAAPVQLADIFPTVLEQTKSNADTSKLVGRSLLTELTDEKPRNIYSESFYAKFHYGWSDLHSLTDGKNHYIQAPRPELYDMVADPKETRNVMQDNRRVYTAMKRAIEPLLKEATTPTAIDPEAAAKLAALGYVGSTVQTKPGEQLADPKDKLEDFKLIQKAFALNAHGKSQEALDILTTLLAANERMTDLWSIKSQCLSRLGRTEEAIEAAKEALRLSPSSVNYALDIANLYLDINQPEAAAQHAELAVKVHPGQAHEVLARAWMARGDLVKAEKEARLSLESKKDRVAALMTLGRIEKQRGNYPAALVYLDQADKTLNEKHSITNLNFMRGDTLARMGRESEAEAAFKMEIQLFPDNVQTYKNLTLLLMSQGRYPEATQLIRDCVKNSPLPPSYLAVAQTLRVVGDTNGARYWTSEGLRKFPRDPSLLKFARTL
jgi:choline-sulfatase